MAKFVIHVLHVGGRLDVNNNGVLSYLDGEVHSFEAIDADTVNIPDLKAYATSLGFPTYTVMHWLEPTDVNLEFGLRDAYVNQLRSSILESNCVDFEIFMEHPISVPVEAEGVEVNVDSGCVNLNSDAETKSSSHDMPG
ncbi:hypothetical protein PIB30_093429 [Stylosanthes scabra]|uniref:PB1-like domain-containing protein n=1 Tax=Stylosanthes scabra TaxID=79078 RepID=A0ABU6UYS4_9FABA|nr:hypothetical protein [Stylosanthes scabra]